MLDAHDCSPSYYFYFGGFCAVEGARLLEGTYLVLSDGKLRHFLINLLFLFFQVTDFQRSVACR